MASPRPPEGLLVTCVSTAPSRPAEPRRETEPQASDEHLLLGQRPGAGRHPQLGGSTDGIHPSGCPGDQPSCQSVPTPAPSLAKSLRHPVTLLTHWVRHCAVTCDISGDRVEFRSVAGPQEARLLGKPFGDRLPHTGWPPAPGRCPPAARPGTSPQRTANLQTSQLRPPLEGQLPEAASRTRGGGFSLTLGGGGWGSLPGRPRLRDQHGEPAHVQQDASGVQPAGGLRSEQVCGVS